MEKPTSLCLQPWTVLHRQPVLSAPPWVNVIQEKVRLPNEKVIEDFYRVVLPHFAVAVPMTSDGRMVLVRSYKHGVGRVTLCPPAGLLDDGEDPLTGARRELLEETGYASTDWMPLGKYVVDGNRQCGTMHAFLARSAQKTQKPKNDDTELLELVLLTQEEVIAALHQGEFANLAGAGSIALALVLGNVNR